MQNIHMQKILLCSCSILLFFSAIGQSNFSGQLKNEKKEAIPYASILLLSKQDSSFLKGTTSNEAGEFTIPSGKQESYILAIQMIGYEDHFQVISQEQVDIGLIELKVNTTLLEGVEIIAEQSSLKSDLGKRVLYVGKDLVNSGGELSDVLSSLPSVEVNTEGVINVRGSSNVVIYINGKESKRDGRALTDLPASMIQKVELITNPSAKYDADGVAGILNIVYRKNQTKDFSTNLSANIAVPLRWQLGLNGNYKNERINLFFNTNYRKSRAENRAQSIQETFDINRRFINRQLAQNIYDNASINGGIEWNVDSSSQLSLEASYFRWAAEEEIQFSNQLNEEMPIQLSNNFSELENEFELALNYQKQFQQKDHQLNFALTYEGENEDNTQTYNLDRVDLSNTSLQNFIRSSEVKEQQRILESKIDYQLPLGQSTLFELGWKGNLIQYDVLQTVLFEDSNFQLADNDFEVTQWKNALYAMLQRDWKDLQMGIGARLEQFQSTATQFSLDSSFQNQTLRLFPSVQIGYEFPDNQSLGFTYSKRIRRPGFFDLNPYIWYDDPLNLSTGNPFLEAELSDLLELSHEWTNKIFQITTTLFRRKTSNSIQEIIRLDNQKSIRSLDNFASTLSEGIEMILRLQALDFWTINAQFSAFHQSFEAQNAELILQNNQSTWSTRIEQKWQLPKDWRVQLVGKYRAPRINPQSILLEQYYVDLGISKQLFDERLNLSLVITDVFKTRVYQETYLGKNFRLAIRDQYQFHRWRLGMTYKIK